MADGQFFTWSALLTMSAASMATFLFVGVTKKVIDRVIPNLPTDLYASFIAFIIVLLASIKQGSDPLDWGVYVLSLLNGLLVWSVAGKMQNVAMNPPGSKKSGDGK